MIDEEPGLIPLIGLSVATLEAMMAAAGMPIEWADGMTDEAKARVAGLVWLRVTPEHEP